MASARRVNTPKAEKNTITRRSLLAAAGLAAVAPARPQSAVAPVKTIRLGQSLPMTGPHALLATSYRQSAAAAFKEANERPQMRELRYELVSLDDGGDPEQTRANVRHLVAGQGAHVLFGFGGEGANRAGAMAAEAFGMPYIAPVSGAVELRSSRRPGAFVFRASHSDEIRYIARHAETIGLSRLALVYESTFLGLEMRSAMLDLLEGARRENAVLTSIDTAGSEYTVPGAVATLMQSNPHAVVLGSNDVASASFVRALRAAGWKGYLYALSSVGSQGLAERLGSLVTGISVTQVVPLPNTDALKVCLDHRAFCARNGIAPTFHTMEAWIGATMFVEATRSLRSTQSTEIAKALRAAREHDFGGYVGRWFESRPNPLAQVSLTVYDRDGRLRT
ncbi:ABC transporter substrate-binding protein [Variovorax terrae]|uniref:ABC transporter substrate-binding protein n=1 Tax=Variovorax terrae TaxID=2923278 RepID=A0A9X1VRZ8_9BURK|nr:ABC transporter substrate-binding protein [Variovorax terrae]MCJ0762267.1 ABC transporter substrate-binding protein [Variovorax terrae]